jgi:hypothetical protein
MIVVMVISEISLFKTLDVISICFTKIAEDR